MSLNTQTDKIITFILPVYNVSPYIERCLNSIYCQKGIDMIQVIIIDDESPDNSIAIAEEWLTAHRDLNVKIIHQRNKGLGGARNTGILNTTTPFIWFVDTDDEIIEGSLEVVLSLLNDNDDVISFSYIEEPAHIERGYYQPLNHIDGSTTMRYTIANQVWRNIYRTDFLCRNNLYFKEKFYHEDGEFSMRIYALAKSISYYPHAIYRYYTNNSSSITNTMTIKNYQDLICYIDTYENMCVQYHLDHSQRWVLQKEVVCALEYIYYSGRMANVDMWRSVQSLIRKNRRRIIKSISLQKFRIRLAIVLMTLFPYKFMCKLFFVRNRIGSYIRLIYRKNI